MHFALKEKWPNVQLYTHSCAAANGTAKWLGMWEELNNLREELSGMWEERDWRTDGKGIGERSSG